MVVGKIPHKECRFSTDVMYAIENVPNGLFVVLKGRIEQVRLNEFEEDVKYTFSITSNDGKDATTITSAIFDSDTIGR